MSSEQKQSSLKWLKEKVFPLWTKKGIDFANGAFIESLSFEAEPQTSARRALVQARQIYSFVEATRLGILNPNDVAPIVEKAVGSLVKNYEQASGAYIHSVDVSGKPQNKDLDLYTQAFVLFGFAQAYDVLRKLEIKHEALKVLKYLLRERKNTAGGFTEIKNGEVFFQSNPHMHLFEAILMWTKIDDDPHWHPLAVELYELCIHKFIDAKTGFLAEHFDANWNSIRENGNFIFEPGHQYEWAWLFNQYEQITGTSVQDASRKLFQQAEKFGLSPEKDLAYDEVWSDGKVKKTSSRFWPQCERIKAAVVLGEHSVADVAMTSLFKNFLLDQGLWRDTLLEKGKFDSQPAKASSLYHIINAISEYVSK